MKKLHEVWLLAIALFFYPAVLHAQRAEAPEYKNGDWWRVKHEVSRAGFDVSGPCSEIFPEHIVKIVDKKPKVFGVKDNQEVALECPFITRMVLGGRDLKFPLYVGLAWSQKEMRSVPGMKLAPVEYKYEVSSWEKVSTAKGDLDAFKIVKSFQLSPSGFKGRQPHWQTQTYFYAPSVKAIVQYRADDQDFAANLSLADFGLGQ